VPIKLPDNQQDGSSPDPAIPAGAGGDTIGASYTSGKVDDKPLPTPSASPARSQPRVPAVMRSPPAGDRQAQADSGADQQQPDALTMLISRDPLARLGTFTPDGASAALTCSIPELVRLPFAQ